MPIKPRRYAYGRRPVVHNQWTAESMALLGAALDTLGPAPTICNNYLKARGTLGPQIYDNDDIGDCVPVDTANRLILRTANSSTQTIVPTVAQVVALYSAVSGYVVGQPKTDVGCTELAMCLYLVKIGFLGHKAASVGAIDPTNIEHVKWGIQMYGGIRLGLNLPDYAEDQFDAGQNWAFDPTKDQTPEGHDTAAVFYDNSDNTIWVDTWGRTIKMESSAFSTWVEESHAELYPDWIQENGTSPAGLDMATLSKNLSMIATQE